MGVEDFQNFIQQKCPGAFVPVDLLKVAQAVGVKQRKSVNGGSGATWTHHNGLHLVIDGECCLDRLYGGYFNDWACGGQWNRMLQFLQLLMTTMQGNQIHVVVFFNGALEMERFNVWSKNEAAKNDKVVQIMRHIRRRRTPPPKILWLPPASLRYSLRLALRHLMVPVFQSVEDHKHEVMSFLRQNDYDALLVEGAEYAFFDPPRYFLAESLKLTFRGNLDAKELILDEAAKQLDLHPNRFSLFAALLGNFIMPEEELLGFYEELFVNVKLDKEEDLHRLIQALLAFVRNLATIDDLPAIGQFIFRHITKESERNEKANRFVRSAQYYMNGTRTHFETFWKLKPPNVTPQNPNHFGQFASESKGGELHDVTANSCAAQIRPLDASDLQSLQNEMTSVTVNDETTNNVDSKILDCTNTTATSSNCSGIDGLATECDASDKNHTDEMNQVANAAICAKNAIHRIDGSSSAHDHNVPDVSSEVLRVSFERHQKGSMHPWIYHCLTKGVIKIDSYLEEGPELPFGWQLWRPVRQRIYAVLFNLNHRLFLSKQEKEPPKDNSNSAKNKSNVPSCVSLKPGKEPGKYPSDLTTRICLKEWICYPKRNVYQQPEIVSAVPLDWKGVPTVQRLWFGRQPDDKKKRLKAFLQCMGADTNLMLDPSHVPQHLLILCCVLKYIINYTECRVLQRHELEAFLAQAVSPQLMDPNSLQELQIKTLTPRGIHLAQLVMQGVEHAFFANDACGAPIAWVMCCPWLFFDGKLFQMKLDIAERNRSLLEVCGGQVEQVSQVERMRQAILEGHSQMYTQPVIPIQAAKFQNGPWVPDAAQRYINASRGGGRGMIGRRDILTRGGQLEVAGVVVGQWGGQAEKNKQARGGSVSCSPQNLPSSLSGAIGRASRPPSIPMALPPPMPYRPISFPPEFYCGPGVFPFNAPPHAIGRNNMNRGASNAVGRGRARGTVHSSVLAPRSRNQGNRTGQSKTVIHQNQVNQPKQSATTPNDVGDVLLAEISKARSST